MDENEKEFRLLREKLDNLKEVLLMELKDIDSKNRDICKEIRDCKDMINECAEILDEYILSLTDNTKAVNSLTTFVQTGFKDMQEKLKKKESNGESKKDKSVYIAIIYKLLELMGYLIIAIGVMLGLKAGNLL